VRVYVRGGSGWGVSVGLVGALVFGLLALVLWFYVALVVVAVLVLAGIGYAVTGVWRRTRRR
jgi:uncharacterized membrane-anchored protein